MHWEVKTRMQPDLMSFWRAAFILMLGFESLSGEEMGKLPRPVPSKIKPLYPLKEDMFSGWKLG